MSWIDAARPEGMPMLPGRTTQGSPSLVVLPPDEGAVLSEIVSVKSAQFFSESRSGGGLRNGCFVHCSEFGSGVLSSNLHPFIAHRLDAGPIRLATITHAFNYRVAVLIYGVRSATRVGRSCRVEGRILEERNVPWGHQVAVMFQIVSALALEVPAFLQNIDNLRGVSPDVQLSCEPWGHVDHSGGDCEHLSPDCTGAYVHGLSLITKECLSVSELEDVSVSSGARMSHVSSIGAGWPGSVPFVSHRPGAYGRLLLALYMSEGF